MQFNNRVAADGVKIVDKNPKIFATADTKLAS